MNEDELEEARRRLDDLATELGVAIGGCGSCCGAPWLVPIGTNTGNISIDGIGLDSDSPTIGRGDHD